MTRSPTQPWSETETRLLIELHHNGATPAEMREILGRSKMSIEAKRRSLDLRADTQPEGPSPCDVHIGHVRASGEAFYVVTSPWIDRINSKEWMPKNMREFWRAA